MLQRSMKLEFLAACLLLVAAPLVADTVALHFALTKAIPEADATVTELHTIRLMFSQAPQPEGRIIRLVDPKGEPVELGDIASDDAKGLSVAVRATGLADGTYTVFWRASGDDGHFMKGDYTFHLRAADGHR